MTVTVIVTVTQSYRLPLSLPMPLPGSNTSTRYGRTTNYFIMCGWQEGLKQSNEKQELKIENEGYLDSSTTYKYMPHAIHPPIPLSACACSTVQKSRLGFGHVFIDS